MSSVPLQYSVTIYIRPDKGPISPLDLDMLALETEVMGLDAHSNRDEARVRLIAERIKSAFPDVDVSGNLSSLFQLIRRLSHVSLFSGVVLPLPGSISGPAQPANPTVKEFARLTEEALYLKDELQKLQQQNSVLEASVPVLRKDAQQLIEANKKQQEKLTVVSAERDDALDRLDTFAKATRVNEVSVSDLQKENAALQVREEQLKRENQRLLRLQNEVAGLRQVNENSKTENQQLRDTVEKYKQEVVRLHQRMKNLEQELGKWKHEHDKLAAAAKDAASILQQQPGGSGSGHAASPQPEPVDLDYVKREWLDD